MSQTPTYDVEYSRPVRSDIEAYVGLAQLPRWMADRGVQIDIEDLEPPEAFDDTPLPSADLSDDAARQAMTSMARYRFGLAHDYEENLRRAGAYEGARLLPGSRRSTRRWRLRA